MNDSEYAVGWGTLALINAALAQSRGRNGLTWFLLSLLLGPIATLLLVTTHRMSDDDFRAVREDARRAPPNEEL